MNVDLEGLAAAVEQVRAELPPLTEQGLDFAGGTLALAAECIRRTAKAEAALEEMDHLCDPVDIEAAARRALLALRTQIGK